MAKKKQTFKDYKCKICSKVFSERGGLHHHLQLHTSDKPFSCNKCTFTCKTRKYLTRHANRVHEEHEKPNECEICGKKFFFKSLLVKHMHIHSDVRPYKCEVCNRGFNSRYSLSSHRHTHTGAKPYKCNYCEYACRDNSTLRKHKERHTGITRLYQCTACDKSYKTKSVLKRHIAVEHMAVDIKTFPCSECGKMFKCLKSLNNHVRLSHLKLYTCKCEICGITLSNKYNMRSHLTSHIDHRPFKCSFEGCGKRFKDKSALKKHSIIHYPEKHFECSICKRKFSRLHRMVAHKKQHKAKKKCVFCDYCGKSFYSKNYICKHITKKHMCRQQYMCDLCDFLTYNKPSLVMHIKYGHVSEMDRKCKICKKTYKKHIYLKLHYWNTHSIKYKLNKLKLRKPKKKNNNIIIEGNSEPGIKEIVLLHEIKVEQMSDTEEMKDGMQYSRDVLSEDINQAISNSDVICPNKAFKDLFIEHIILPSSSNDEGAKPYKCNYCEYACRDNSTLRKHKERHTGITRLYQCTACDKSYKTKSVLKRHIAVEHMAVDIKTFPCSECGKMFKCLKSLNNHVRLSHLKLYTCKCEICGITLSNKYNMRSHLTSHIDHRPFKCSFEGCGKRFKDKSALKKHSIIHYPEKHFECSICKRKFSRLHRMVAHKKQHKAKKKCVFCDYCGKSFYSKNYICKHITKKHMCRQQYMCDLCDFLTYNKPSLVMHIKYGHVSEMDRKCKICKKTYKKHIYLKLHYWNTHSIKYKLNKLKLRKPKKKNNNIIIEGNSEPGIKEIVLLHEIKVEQMSDTEEMKDGMQYSRDVLSEDINQAISNSDVICPNKAFKDLFIEHIILPSSSNDEETQQNETDIYVDVTCQKEAERVRTEMLERWKPSAGVRPFVRLKRHYDVTDNENNLNTVKNEKIEVTLLSENEPNGPIREKVSKKIEVNRKHTKKSRRINYCDKINEILKIFNNEIVCEDENISRINHKISKIGEQIQKSLEKDSIHHKKQIIKKLNRALAKYNNLVQKVRDIHNKEPELLPENDDVTSGDMIHKGANDLISVGDEPRQNSEDNCDVTSTNIHDVINNEVIERNDEHVQSSIGDENKLNSKYNFEKPLENVVNKSDDMTRGGDKADDEVIKNVECKKLGDELTSSENGKNRSYNVIENGADDLVSIGDENRQNDAYKGEITALESCENRSGDVVQKGDDDFTSIGDENRRNSEYKENTDENISCDVIDKSDIALTSIGYEHNTEYYNGAITEYDGNRNSDMIETGDDDLTPIGDEYIHKEYKNETITSVNDDNISSDMTQTSSILSLTGGDDFKELSAEMELEDDEVNVCIVTQKGNDLASIDDKNRLNSDDCTNSYDEVENFDKQEPIDHRSIKYSGGYNEINDNATSSENYTIFNYIIEKGEELASIGDEILTSKNDESRNCNVIKKGANQVLIGDECLLNSNDCKKLEWEISSENDEISEFIKTGDDQASLADENSQINASAENDENITIDNNLLVEQVSIEVNQLYSSENGILYENSLAELVKLRKRKCVKNVKSSSYIDGTDNEEFVYMNNIKEIDSIIKDIDNIVALIDNPKALNNDECISRETHIENTSEKLKLVKSIRKPRKKRSKRTIKKKVGTKSGINKMRKTKEEKMGNNDELEKINDEIESTEVEKIASAENYETLKNNPSDLQEISIENQLEEGDTNKYWTRRSVRNRNKKIYTDFVCHNDFDSDGDRDRDFVPNGDDDDESGDEMKNKSDKFKLNTHQCYVCFKLYETKQKLVDHCKEHFDICNPKMLKKCPFCEYVTNLDLVKHVRLIHKVNLNYLYGTLKDRKNNNCNKSRFYFNVKNNLVNEVEVIPSITNLNRQEYLKIDRKRREKNDKEVKKAKLVKKDGEWIVEKVLVNTKKENYILPDKVEELLKNKEKQSKNGKNDKSGKNIDKEPRSDEDAGNNHENVGNNDKKAPGIDNNVGNNEKQLEQDKIDGKNDGKESKNDDYCAKLQRLYRIAKKNGQKMLFPCNQCEKICQTLSALKLHLRRHDPNAKPFKKKVWKHKLNEEELKKLKEDKEKSKKITKNNKNRYEKPKPIMNKHKCDPKLKDFYEKNIKGGDIEFWQFLKIFNKMSRENVNNFSDLENRTEFGIHFIDPKLNPPNEKNSSPSNDLNSGSSNSKVNKKRNSKTLVDKMGVVNKIRKENKFQRTILISKKEFLRRKAMKDSLRKKNVG